jgi:hypothetical protein
MESPHTSPGITSTSLLVSAFSCDIARRRISSSVGRLLGEGQEYKIGTLNFFDRVQEDLVFVKKIKDLGLC